MTIILMRFRNIAQRAKRENIFLFYSSSSLLLQVSTIFATFAVLRFVPPDEMGVWRTLVVTATYLNFVTLGAPNGLARELPFLLGQGNKEKALQLAAVAQFYMIFIAIAGAVGFLILLILFPELSHEWSLALIVMAIIWSFGSYRSYLGVTYRSEHEFRRLTYINISDLVLTFLSLLLVIFGGYIGMIFRLAFLIIASTMTMHAMRPLRIRPRMNLKDLRELLSTGIPQYFGGYLLTVSMAFEQTIIGRQGGVQQIGLYASVAAVSTAMLAIHASIVTYINPRIIFKLGKYNNLLQVFRDTRSTVFLLAMICMPAVFILSIVTPFLLSTLFPKYADTLTAVQIALIGGIFLAINASLTGLYAIKAWKYVATYAISAVILRWVIPSYFATNMEGKMITNVAAGGAIANVLVFAIGMILLWFAVRNEHRKQSATNMEISSAITSESE